MFALPPGGRRDDGWEGGARPSTRDYKERLVPMNEIIFEVAEAPEGGYTARACGASIFTEAATLPGLRDMVRDAVHCHFDDGEIRAIRLRGIGAKRGAG